MKVKYQFIVLVVIVTCVASQPLSAQDMPAFAGIFGSRELDVENPNAPGTNYSMLLHQDDPGAYDDLEYDEARGYGFVVQNDGSDGGDRFGPFDASPNGRGNFDPDDDLYNSFIGFKNFSIECNVDTIGDRDAPCSTELDPEGGIFRVDVPNGSYRFVAVMGDSDHPHAHRLLAEDGGSGGPADIGENFVTLIGNHNQADYWHGTGDVARFGSGVFARVGFDGKMPPEPKGPDDGSLPAFVDYGENGEALTECTSPVNPDDDEELLWKDELITRHDGEEYSVPAVECTSPGPSSPTLEVTQGYIRFHMLQANSNMPVEAEDGQLFFTPEDAEVNVNGDPNGGDIVLLEVWPAAPPVNGDFDGDGMLTANDIDLLTDEVIAGTNMPQFDLNGDALVNNDDRDVWVVDLKTTYYGDANLDGEFNSGDMVHVFTIGHYEDGIAGNSGWNEGDWDGDKDFTSGDFVAAFSGGGYEQGPRVAAVPEPSSIALLLIGMLALVRRR